MRWMEIACEQVGAALILGPFVGTVRDRPRWPA